MERADLSEAERDAEKRSAAEAAVALVADGMRVGLGTGSTARFVIELLGERVRKGLRCVGVATSQRSADQARALGIPLEELRRDAIDLTIDGADEVETGSLHLIKGLGGALLHEKLVAAQSRRLVIVVDSTKLVAQLGAEHAVPVEVVAFGHQATQQRLEALGANVRLRRAPNGEPLLTESHNLILDCDFGIIEDPAALERHIKRSVGVVESGLFVGLTEQIYVGSATGVQSLRPA